MTDYEQGYKDGMSHISQQVSYINQKFTRITQILTKAVFTNEASVVPKTNMHIWLVLDKDMITSGYYIGGNYISDSGHIMYPTHWCMIPSEISGRDETEPRRRIARGNSGQVDDVNPE
jgi:hypothetical protein